MSKSTAIAMLAAVVFAALLSGCSDEPSPTPSAWTAPTDTPTPAPTSTPTPTPPHTSESGFDLYPDSVWQEVFDALATSEQSCVRDVLGDDLEWLLAQSVLREEEDDSTGAFFSCLDPENARAVFLFGVTWSFEEELDRELSDLEAACAGELVASIDVAAVVAGPEDSAEAEEFAVLMMISCFPDQFIAAFVSGFGGLIVEDLSDEELDCARELMGGIDVAAILAGPEDSSEYMNVVAADIISCIPDKYIATVLSELGFTLEDLSDEELDCARELMAGIDVAAILAGPEDSAEVEEFGAGMVSCAPELLGAAPTTSHSSTPTPEPTAAAEPVADTQLSAAEVYARVAPSIVFIEIPAGTGSGVLIDEGYIVTNRHVVWPYESVWVTFPDGAWYEDVPVIGWDALSDLAVLGPVETSVAPSELADGEGLAPGSELYLVGYPAETEVSPEPTISRGILSRFREWEWFGMTYFQTDASIAGGQSGGALVNDRGQVVGISTFRFSEAGFGLATSITDDIVIIEDLIRWGWDTADPARRRLEIGEVAFDYTLEMPNGLTFFTFVLDGEAGKTLQLELDGSGDGAFAVSRTGGLIVEVDAGITGTEYVELELEADEPHFVTVGTSSEAHQVFELSSNVPLGHLLDPDDGETIQVWEALTGNVDYPYDADVFWLQLEEGESVAVFVESVSIDTHVVVGFLGALESIASDNDGAGGAFGTDSALFYRALQAGSYFIFVSNAIGPGVGGYLLGVEAIDALEYWDDNGDGKITCDEATASNITTPVSFTHPAYAYMQDDDSDGLVCG